MGRDILGAPKTRATFVNMPDQQAFPAERAIETDFLAIFDEEIFARILRPACEDLHDLAAGLDGGEFDALARFHDLGIDPARHQLGIGRRVRRRLAHAHPRPLAHQAPDTDALVRLVGRIEFRPAKDMANFMAEDTEWVESCEGMLTDDDSVGDSLPVGKPIVQRAYGIGPGQFAPELEVHIGFRGWSRKKQNHEVRRERLEFRLLACRRAASGQLQSVPEHPRRIADVAGAGLFEGVDPLADLGLELQPSAGGFVEVLSEAVDQAGFFGIGEAPAFACRCDFGEGSPQDDGFQHFRRAGFGHRWAGFGWGLHAPQQKQAQESTLTREAPW